MTRKYNLILKSNDCFQTITTATQVTTCLKTLMDHIVPNNSELEITFGVFNFQILDYSLNFTMLSNKKAPPKNVNILKLCKNKNLVVSVTMKLQSLLKS